MTEITVVARAMAKKGKEKELEKALREVVGPTHQEKGCLRYVIHQGIENPSNFLVVERWASQADHLSHLQSSHVQELFQKVPPLVEGAPEILSYQLLTEGDKNKGFI